MERIDNIAFDGSVAGSTYTLVRRDGESSVWEIRQGELMLEMTCPPEVRASDVLEGFDLQMNYYGSLEVWMEQIEATKGAEGLCLITTPTLSKRPEFRVMGRSRRVENTKELERGIFKMHAPGATIEFWRCDGLGQIWLIRQGHLSLEVMIGPGTRAIEGLHGFDEMMDGFKGLANWLAFIKNPPNLSDLNLRRGR